MNFLFSFVSMHQGAKGVNITIDTVCETMTNTKLGDPIIRYAAINTQSLWVSQDKCLNFLYSDMIADLKRDDWNSTAAVGGNSGFCSFTCIMLLREVTLASVVLHVLCMCAAGGGKSSFCIFKCIMYMCC